MCNPATAYKFVGSTGIESRRAGQWLSLAILDNIERHGIGASGEVSMAFGSLSRGRCSCMRTGIGVSH
ncbi:hypothetical protein BD414DRAFT_484468, partial [Trametes punicea]